jgi:protocatechuate 3,4-dioxygenase beta subunit
VETVGPYPGDGSNGVNVLTESGIVRSDITRSFGSASGVAEGVPLTIKRTVLDTTDGAGPLQGAAVYLWHRDREGRYSLYSEGSPRRTTCAGSRRPAATGR